MNETGKRAGKENRKEMVEERGRKGMKDGDDTHAVEGSVSASKVLKQ